MWVATAMRRRGVAVEIVAHLEQAAVKRGRIRVVAVLVLLAVAGLALYACHRDW